MMKDGWGDSRQAGITWREVHAYMKDIEREFGYATYIHLWPDISQGKIWRMAIRIEATTLGAGYRGKAACHYYEMWPNGRQPTLCSAIYRGLLDIYAMLEELEEKRGAKV